MSGTAALLRHSKGPGAIIPVKSAQGASCCLSPLTWPSPSISGSPSRVRCVRHRQPNETWVRVGPASRFLRGHGHERGCIGMALLIFQMSPLSRPVEHRITLSTVRSPCGRLVRGVPKPGTTADARRRKGAVGDRRRYLVHCATMDRVFHHNRYNGTSLLVSETNIHHLLRTCATGRQLPRIVHLMG